MTRRSVPFILCGIGSLAVSPVLAQPNGGQLVVKPTDVIALEEGTWEVSVLSPEGKEVATGVQVNERRSGGAWMLNLMSVNGGAYQGTGLWGFDSVAGRYTGTWVDGRIPRMRTDFGTWNPHTMTMTWTSETKLADGRIWRVRATSVFDGDTRTYRSFTETGSGEVGMSTVIFRRRRSAS